MILTSATDELALDFSAAARDTMIEHGHLFGLALSPDTQAKHRWAVDRGGMMRAAGVGGSIIGRGADLLICDDYFKSHEPALSETQRENVYKWYSSTAATRLTPNGAEVIVATRWHPKDLIGRLLADQPGKWRRITLPAMGDDGAALWPERYNADWMHSKRQDLVNAGYEWMWEALYQQNPPEVLDAEFRAECFGDHIWFDQWPREEEILYRVIALDPSLGESDKSDYSAFAMLAIDRNFTMWVDADLQRRDVSRTIDDGLQHIKMFRPFMFGVETNMFQKVLKDMFVTRAAERGVMLNIYGINSTTNKRARISAGLSAYLNQRQFRFKRNSPGASLLVEQLRGFPAIKHDDGPDALEMAVKLVTHLVNHGAEE